MECPSCHMLMEFEWDTFDNRGVWWECLGCGFTCKADGDKAA